MAKALKPAEWIFEHFDRKMADRQHEYWGNIFWRVAVMSIPPRDPRFEFIKEMGCGQLDNILCDRPINMSATTERGGQHLRLVFPERHLTTQEEHILVPCLQWHHQIKDAPLTIIDIVTKSPLMVGNFLKEDVRIIRDAEDFDNGLSNECRKAFPKL